MPSKSHGRICFVAALCLITLFLLLNFSHNGETTAYVHRQYSSSSQNGIGNATLGFEKILAVNLPWRTDRRDSLTLAAARSGLTIEWINGINASQIDERAFPQGNHRSMSKGNVGSWRAHMDAMLTIVEKNLTSALILEDDADWDERVREQLMNAAAASRRLPGMIAQYDAEAQAKVPATEEPSHEQQILDAIELAKRSTVPLPSPNKRPSSDPYGHDWDILWLGHCGTAPPPHEISSPPHGADRFMLLDDSTVPLPSHLRPSHTAPLDSISSIYPPNTRIYHRSHGTLCTIAYAVTQRGARKILYEHSIRNLDKGYDFALSEWCDGLTKNAAERPTCLTSSPPIFSHFWPDGGQTGGGKSDIAGIGAGGVESGSAYLVESVRGKLERDIEGEEIDL